METSSSVSVHSGPAHLHREKPGEVVLPVVPSSNDDPPLHVVVLDGTDGRSHVKMGWKVEGHAERKQILLQTHQVVLITPT